MQNEILNFIKRRWSIDANWTNGNCFWFAKILQLRFPQLQIYYLPIIGHFITSDGENYYDWNGIYLPEEELGVRIEDLVLITEDGCEVLNKYTKEIIVVPFEEQH